MQTGERADWHKLGNMLGCVVGWDDNSLYSPTTGCAMLLCGDDALPEHTREAQAMLIGLAEFECNGSVWGYGNAGHGDVVWGWMHHDETGHADSRPAAAIAMLEAYRKDRGC